jgi:hypothetical protein
MTVHCVLLPFPDNFSPLTFALRSYLHILSGPLYTDHSQTYCPARSLAFLSIPGMFCVTAVAAAIQYEEKLSTSFIFPQHSPRPFHVLSLYTSGFGEAV